MSNKCQYCDELVDEKSSVNVCEKCQSIQAVLKMRDDLSNFYILQFNTKLDLYGAWSNDLHLLYFTERRIICVLFSLNAGQSVIGLSAQSSSALAAAITINNTVKKLWKLNPDSLLGTFPLNFSIHYEDIIKFSKEKFYCLYYKDGDKEKKISFNIKNKYKFGAERLLLKYIKPNCDIENIEHPDFHSSLLDNIMVEKDPSLFDSGIYSNTTILGFFLTPEFINELPEIMRLVEQKRHFKALIEKCNKVLDNQNLNPLEKQIIYILRGDCYAIWNAYSTLLKKPGPVNHSNIDDYEKSIEIHNEIPDEDPLKEVSSIFNTYIKGFVDEYHKAKSKECFVATAATGSGNSKEVKILRNWRDEYLKNTSYGRVFIRYYYSKGPILASLIRDRKVLMIPSRWLIIKPISKLAEYFMKSEKLK